MTVERAHAVFFKQRYDLFNNSRKKSIEAHLSMRLKMWKMCFGSMEKSILIEPISSVHIPEIGLLLRMRAFFFVSLFCWSFNRSISESLNEYHALNFMQANDNSSLSIKFSMYKPEHSLHNSLHLQTNACCTNRGTDSMSAFLDANLSDKHKKTHVNKYAHTRRIAHHTRMNPFVEIQFPFDRTRSHTAQKLTLRLGLVCVFVMSA